MGGANLTQANLNGTNLQYADMFNVSLDQTKLKGANMQHAELKKAYLENGLFDETTILPDGSHWTPNADMRRFTDPNHPEFWRSDDPNSPAYRDKTT